MTVHGRVYRDTVEMSRRRRPRRTTFVLALAVLGGSTGCSSSSTTGHPSHRTAGRAVNDVVVENARVGTAGWQLTRVGGPHEIEGWADRTSVLAGQPVGLHVSTTARSYTVHAVRIGWYGGRLGRQVWASPALTGVQQQPPRIVGSVHTVLTSWPVSTMVPTRVGQPATTCCAWTPAAAPDVTSPSSSGDPARQARW